jgi:hypothetical protein
VLVLCEILLERVEFILIELVRWTEAQPADVDPLYAQSSTPTTASRFRRWAGTSPGRKRLHQERITPAVALLVEFALELRHVGATGLADDLANTPRLKRRRR